MTDDEQKIADAEPKKPSARPTGWPQWSWPRACLQLRRMAAQARWTAARKILASLS